MVDIFQLGIGYEDRCVWLDITLVLSKFILRPIISRSVMSEFVMISKLLLVTAKRTMSSANLRLLKYFPCTGIPMFSLFSFEKNILEL